MTHPQHPITKWSRVSTYKIDQELKRLSLSRNQKDIALREYLMSIKERRLTESLVAIKKRKRFNH